MSDWEMTPMTDFAPFPEQETIDESNHNSVDSAEETGLNIDFNNEAQEPTSTNEEVVEQPAAEDDVQTDNEGPTEEQEDG